MSPSAAERASASSARAAPAAETHLHGRKLLIVRSLWLMLATGLFANFLFGIVTYYAQLHTVCLTDPEHCNFFQLVPANVPALHQLGLSVADYAAAVTCWDVAVSLLLLLVGAFIFWRKSAAWYGLFVSLLLVTFGCSGLGNTLALAAQVSSSPLVPFTLLSNLAWPAVGFFLVTFPTGRFTPRWTWLIALLWVIQLLEYALPSPFGYPDWPGWLQGVNHLVVYGSTAAVQFYRYRRLYTPLERQQTKWLVFGVVLSVPILGFADLQAPNSPYQLLGVVFAGLEYMAIILALGVAILQYRLWDIDLVINRTLVYGALTASVVGFYVLVVGYLGTLFRTGSNLLISLVATGGVAVLFQPVRGWLQRGVNRLMYGERDAPYAVLARLGSRLEATLVPETVLPTIVETIAQALKLPYVAIALLPEQQLMAAVTTSSGEAVAAGEQEASIAASYGTPTPGLMRIPLVYQAETLGYLLLAARAGDTFGKADSRLLTDLARQAGVAMYAVRLTTHLQHLTTSLQQARERLVTTREEERRRLRRDLHDGLGPALASVTFKVDAARNLLRQDSERTERLLAEVRQQAQEAISDIRRLVYNLRPPALDEFGLLSVLREQAAHCQHQGLEVTFDTAQSLPPLPAAVEVAVYRIAQEALTNVVRHAQAQHCLLRLALDTGAVQLTISDDGQGIPPGHRIGVGLHAMHERASELGGSCTITQEPSGGTTIQVWLPRFPAKGMLPAFAQETEQPGREHRLVSDVSLVRQEE